jgi:hypothetical protein
MYRGARDRLLLVEFVDSALRPQLQTFDAAAVAEHRQGRHVEFLANLEEIRRECEQRGIVFVVASQQACSLTVPRPEMRGMTYAREQELVAGRLQADGKVTPPEVWFLTHGDLMAAEREWVEEHRVPFADGIAALNLRRDHLYSWVHLAPQGNALLAGAVAPVVVEAVGSAR